MIPEPRHFACHALPIELLALIFRAKSPLIYSTISCYVRNIILSVLEYIFAFIHTIFTLHVQRDIVISAVCNNTNYTDQLPDCDTFLLYYHLEMAGPTLMLSICDD